MSKGTRYVISKSGYTQRLIHYFDFVKYEIRGNKIIKCENEHICNEDCGGSPDECADDTIEPLFINDFSPKEFWANHNLNIEKYKEDILKLVRLAKSAIFFENLAGESFVYIQFVQNLRYCGGLRSIYDVTTHFEGNDFFAILYEMDTESG